MNQIKTTRYEVELETVSDVAVTAIFRDDVVGDFYRDIVFFGEPPEPVEGTAVVDTSTIPTLMRVRIRASAVDSLKITVPQDEF